MSQDLDDGAGVEKQLEPVSLANGRAFRSKPAILSNAISRVDFGIARESLIVSPSLAPDSSNSSFGIINSHGIPYSPNFSSQ